MTFTALSFRTVAGEFGFSRVAGLPTLRVVTLFPCAACPADLHMPSPRTVRGIFGSARTRVSFTCFRETWSNRSHGRGWGVRAWLLLSSLIPRRAAYGWDLLRVAWRISKTVRSAHRTQPLMVWVRAVLTHFDSVLAVRCGPRPKAG